MTHNITAVWHVFVNGAWMAVEHEGYAPVNVWVDDSHIMPVKYRHLANGCESVACSHLELLTLV